jgi:hypothetical protein
MFLITLKWSEVWSVQTKSMYLKWPTTLKWGQIDILSPQNTNRKWYLYFYFLLWYLTFGDLEWLNLWSIIANSYKQKIWRDRPFYSVHRYKPSCGIIYDNHHWPLMTLMCHSICHAFKMVRKTRTKSDILLKHNTDRIVCICMYFHLQPPYLTDGDLER